MEGYFTKIELILMVAAMLCIGTDFASAELYITVDHQVYPTKIWPVGSGVLPNEAQVTLTVRGEGIPQIIPVEMIMAIDSSSHMNGSDPDQGRLLAAESLIMAMNASKDRVGVVSFDDDVDFAQPLTNDLSSAINKTGEVDSEGGASLDVGLNASIDLLVGNDTNLSAAKVILLLTDGGGGYTPSGELDSPEDRAIEEGIAIYAIGLNLNDSATEERLINLTSATGGSYYRIAEIDTIESIYQEISTTEVAGEEVALLYSLPAGLNASGFSIEPELIEIGPVVTILGWDLGTVLTGGGLNVFFNISATEGGTFNLMGTVVFTHNYSVDGYLDIEAKSVEVLNYRSGISVKMIEVPDNFSGRFSSIVDYADLNPLFESARYNEDFLVLEYEDSGDEAFVFDDGRLVVASDDELTLNKRDELSREISSLIFGLEQSGIRITDRYQNSMRDDAVYYAEGAIVYHDMLIGLEDDTRCSIKVPNCTIIDTRLTITGEDPVYLDPRGLCYYIDGEKVHCCWGCPDIPNVPASGWFGLISNAPGLIRRFGYDFCTVPPSDIANRISRPGVHEISVTQVDAEHTMSIEVITTHCPEKFEFIHGADVEVIREGMSQDILAFV